MAKKRKSAQLDIEDVIAAAAPGVPGSGKAIDVPYDMLVPAHTVNARAGDYRPDGIDELAALIRSMGLIHPLTVRRRAEEGTWEVYDGERRRQAVGLLIAAGDWPAGRPVPCIVRDEDDAAARETSLVANIAREPMHPVRELEVFAELHGAGADVDTIAQRYGVSARVVRQRLALGGLAPEIREAWRAGEIRAETAQAFAVCPEAARQAAAFKTLQERRNLWPQAVRQLLVKDKPRLDDPRLALVGGLDAYRAAGGTVVESLFKDDGYLEDGELLDEQVRVKMEQTCADLRADGWSFAFTVDEVKGEAHWSWSRVQPGKVTHTAEEATRLKELDIEQDALEALDTLDDEQSDRVDAIHDERNRIEGEAQSRAYTKAQKAKSGCIVDGDTITYGLVRPSAKKAAAAAAKTAQDGHQDADDGGDPRDVDEGDEGEADEARISNSLMMTISEAQTIAAAKALAASPAVALAIVIAGLNAFNTGPVKITANGHHSVRGEHEATAFAEAIADLDGKDLSVELARAVSRTLDLRRYTSGPQYTSGFQAFDVAGITALVSALPGAPYLDRMRGEFDAGDYFHRSPAAVIRAAIDEMTAPAKRDISPKVKKSDLVVIATELAGPTGWLPAELRHPDYRMLHHKDHADEAKPAGKKRKKVAA